MEGVKKYLYFYCVRLTKNGSDLLMDGTITTEELIKTPEDFTKLSMSLKNSYETEKLIIMNLNLLYGE